MSMLLNAFALAAALIYPDYAYAENLSAVAEAASVPTALASITGLQTEAGKKYLVLWNTQVTGTSTSGGADVILNIDGGGFESASTSHFTESSPFDQRTHSGIYVFAGDGSTHNFVLQGNRGFTVGTSTFTNSSIFVLKLGPNDIYAADVNQTTSSTTGADMLTLNFTPPSARDYLILGFAAIGSNNTGANPFTLLNDGTGAYGANVNVDGSVSTRHPVLTMRKLTGVSAAQTIKLQKGITNGSFVATFNYPHLVAIDLSRFASAIFTVLGAANAGTQTAYTTGLSQTFTPAAAPHLIIGAGFSQGSVTTASTYERFVDNGTVLTESVQAAFSMPLSALRMRTFAASSRTQSIDRKSETTGVTATQVANLNAIADLNLSGLLAA